MNQEHIKQYREDVNNLRSEGFHQAAYRYENLLNRIENWWLSAFPPKDADESHAQMEEDYSDLMWLRSLSRESHLLSEDESWRLRWIVKRFLEMARRDAKIRDRDTWEQDQQDAVRFADTVFRLFDRGHLSIEEFQFLTRVGARFETLISWDEAPNPPIKSPAPRPRPPSPAGP